MNPHFSYAIANRDAIAEVSLLGITNAQRDTSLADHITQVFQPLIEFIGAT